MMNAAVEDTAGEDIYQVTFYREIPFGEVFVQYYS